MGTDLSTLSILSAVALGGNIETLEFSLGGEDNRTYSPTGIGSRQAGRQLGLAGHSRCEGDISAIRRDYFTNNGGMSLGIRTGKSLNQHFSQIITMPTPTDSSDSSNWPGKTAASSMSPLRTRYTARMHKNPSGIMTSCFSTRTLSLSS